MNKDTLRLPHSNIDLPIYSKLYDFYKHLSQITSSFPKIKRYTLAQQIDLLTLNILELVIRANYLTSTEKLTILNKASIKLDLLKILIRLSYDTKCIDSNKYQILSSRLIEIGRMLGGWIKSIK